LENNPSVSACGLPETPNTSKWYHHLLETWHYRLRTALEESCLLDESPHGRCSGEDRS
jgi:hypothetical protein